MWLNSWDIAAALESFKLLLSTYCVDSLNCKTPSIGANVNQTNQTGLVALPLTSNHLH